jgi:hypothetical protein
MVSLPFLALPALAHVIAVAAEAARTKSFVKALQYPMAGGHRHLAFQLTALVCSSMLHRDSLIWRWHPACTRDMTLPLPLPPKGCVRLVWVPPNSLQVHGYLFGALPERIGLQLYMTSEGALCTQHWEGIAVLRACLAHHAMCCYQTP